MTSWLSQKLRPVKVKSGYSSDNHGVSQAPCLCTVARPLARLVQVFGLHPVTFDTATHKLDHTWLSLPVLANFAWILAICAGSMWVRSRFVQVSGQVVSGTDFYSTNITILVNALASILVYMFGNFGARAVGKCWDNLHAAFEELELPNYKLLRRGIFVVVILILEELATDFGMCFLGYMQGELEIEGMGVLLGLSSFLLNFVPNLLCGCFSGVCWIIAIHFKAINDQATAIMTTACASSEGCDDHGRHLVLAHKMARLRSLHEKLCGGVSYLQRAFGIQLLAIFTSTGLLFVNGIYMLIVTVTGLKSSANKFETMSYAFSFSYIFSGFRIVVILILSEYLTSKGNEVGRILNRFDTSASSSSCGPELKRQVKEFRSKIGMFPLRLTCCNIFPLSTTVLAPAAGSIVTYVLVLMQFKLGSTF